MSAKSSIIHVRVKDDERAAVDEIRDFYSAKDASAAIRHAIKLTHRYVKKQRAKGEVGNPVREEPRSRPVRSESARWASLLTQSTASINRVGNNANQIARRVNSGEVVELQEFVAELRELVAQIQAGVHEHLQS
ncbi:MobC family plasmid mobilization relaxosome protein [Gordonia pseudamarae]|uniref:Plasmid mobilization relaxosome protein MobC n=1 Tax=Gordonia pseudamarae TaxID=2831662 RepID=A0ABX6ILS9_9ACTN|nr:MobC family plasmid mobilization relaxosome protein [Gordonia pseudamarae]QHN36878.1 plasmid mobilization relaxosome protein MobC [Gordonia pseudamarae]